MTYEQLIDKANLCIIAAFRCRTYGAIEMSVVWYNKAKELRAKANMLPCGGEA